jgi:putative ABC transport system permease protein
MEMRLAWAGMWRRRGTATLAVLAIAIGASVASALLHVSRDVGDQLSHELRALGPNLLLVPDTLEGGAGGALGAPAEFLPERAMRERLHAAAIDHAPQLLVIARANGRSVPVIGTDLAAARRLHPAWRVEDGGGVTLIGRRLAERLGVVPGGRLVLEGAGGRTSTLPVGARIEAGGADDDAFWIPLADAQALSGRPDQVSLFQARIEGGATAAARATADLERGGGARVMVLHALTDTEAGLLERMRRLMALVTACALVAAGLCAFGTLTDLALERRRDVALMKSLGATRRDVIRLFASESLVIGLLGGAFGWLIGLGFAAIIGREVFHTSIALRGDVPLIVLGLSLAVAAMAGLGPIRLALAVEPAAALKGD